MKRREFITLLGGAVVPWPVAAHAQQPDRVRRIGVLMLYPEDDPEGQLRATALRNGLQKRGWGRRRQYRDRFSMGFGRRRLDTICRRAVAAISAGRDPSQRHTSGADNAAVDPHGSRHLHRRQRPSRGWLGDKSGPSGWKLDGPLRF